PYPSQHLVDSSNLHANPDWLARVLSASQSSIDSGFVAVLRLNVPVAFTTFGRVVFPAQFEIPSKDLSVEFHRPFGIVRRNSKITDSRHVNLFAQRKLTVTFKMSSNFTTTGTSIFELIASRRCAKLLLKIIVTSSAPKHSVSGQS